MSERRVRWGHVATAGAVLAVVAAGLSLAGGNWSMGDALLSVVAYVRDAGAVGVAVFSVGFMVWAVLCLPASWPQMASGFLYGPWVGFGLGWVLSVGAAGLNAWLGRTLLSARVQAALEARGGVAARLQARLAEQGTGLVVLLRMPPVSPFHPLSYALGASVLPLRSVLMGTAIGGVVPVGVYTWLGASVTELARLLDGDSGGAGFWVSGGVTLVATVLITVRVRRELQDLTDA